MLVAVCLTATFCSTADYSSDPDYRTVERVADRNDQLVGEPITMTATLANTSASDVRAFYYTDYLPPEFDVNTVSVEVDGAPATGYLYEVGYAGDVYPGAVSHRWVIETPSQLAQPVTSACVIVYTVTSSAESSYTLPGYTWAGYDMTASLGLFGYETEPPVLDFVSPGSGTGTVVVDVTPDTASWTVTDGESGVHSDTGDATFVDIPSGTIQIAYDPLEDYRPPPGESQVLTADGTVSFAGVYTYAAPAATVSSPVDGYDLAVSSSVDIVGTVQDSDDDLSDFSWVLERTEGPLPSGTWVVLAAGTQNVVAGTLAVWNHRYDLEPGEYACLLRCTNQYGVSSAELTLENNLTAPAAPSNPTPSSGALHITALDSLVWQWSALAHHSDLYLWHATESRPADPVGVGLTAGEWPVPGLLDPYTEWSWQVIAVNGAGSTEGTTWSFTTDDSTPPSVPGQPLPECTPVLSATYPSGRYYAVTPAQPFAWSAAADLESGVDTYRLKAGSTPEGADVYDAAIGNVTQFSIVADHGQIVYVRVAACNGDGVWSDYSPASPAVCFLDPDSDSDGDGISAGAELDSFGTDPTVADTDGDQLPDGYEVFVSQTDPTKLDTDGNGVPDGEEDPDGDGFSTLDEYRAGRDPTESESRPGTLRFTDNSGVSVSSYIIEVERVYVELDQPAQNQDDLVLDTVTLTVSNTISGDIEMVTLMETSVTSGIFFSNDGLPTRPFGQLAVDDGTLKSLSGSYAAAVYTDPDVPEDVAVQSALLLQEVVTYGTPVDAVETVVALVVLTILAAWTALERRCHRRL